jgi:Ca-activated chloride channel family protein
MTLLGGAVLLILAGAPALAQVFRGGIDMVALTVTVTDGDGHSVSGLTASHFAVYEDGVEQEVSLFGAEDVPVDVALVTDASSSMHLLLPAVRDGGQALLGRLRPGDRAAVYAVRGRTDVTAPLTADLAAVRTAVRDLHASGTTALYDAVYLALRQFHGERTRNPGRRRQALVIFSDGVDNASHVGHEDVIAAARSQDVTIYTITLQEPTFSRLDPDDNHRRWMMRTLAFETGGQAFLPTQPEEMRSIYDTIARELISQYALAYVAPPEGEDATFRRVSVRLLPPAHGAVRTRTGYIRPRGPKLRGAQIDRANRPSED